MANYSFEVKNTNPIELWERIRQGLNNDVIVKSLDYKIHYIVHEINDIYISYSAPSRNNGAVESISYEDFVKTVSNLFEFETFNTSLAKVAFKGGKIYRKRSPLFAILKSSGIIRKIT